MRDYYKNIEETNRAVLKSEAAAKKHISLIPKLKRACSTVGYEKAKAKTTKLLDEAKIKIPARTSLLIMAMGSPVICHHAQTIDECYNLTLETFLSGMWIETCYSWKIKYRPELTQMP